jgi:UDP-N-acetylmuramoyl-tripeptide--D-alanyl-D-alanine ligase
VSVPLDDLRAVTRVRSAHLETLKLRSFRAVSTDSRTVGKGELFIALRGGQFDGHAFVSGAFERGAACAVVDAKADTAAYADRPHVVVKDTTRALGELATAYRRRFTIPVIAVGGSNGKTTTKEMLTAVLATTYKVLATAGNLNNHIGVPQTIFRLRPGHEAAVVEVGTNHFGELAYLCRVLEPTHALLTNIGSEHLEFFKDLKGVAKAEGELFLGLPRSGTAFVNVDDPLVARLAVSARTKVTYGFSGPRAAVRGVAPAMDAHGCPRFGVKTRGAKEFRVALATPGTHGMMNALAATAVGVTLGVPPARIAKALGSFAAVGKRMEVVRIGGVTILNDTYNANTDSVLAALETLDAMASKGQKIVILGDMLELGATSRREHERVGDRIKELGFRNVLTFGPESAAINRRLTCDVNFHYEQKNMLSEYAAELVARGDVVLVKGSRGMRMEDVVTFLRERLKRRTA